ncbi:MAG TPA: hypothetical protein VNA29_08610 [Sphingomicrobium sp.]|nr:hypothetical protein [Sphingomicrobium sp.]
MMMLFLAAVGAASPTAVDAERAFGRDAQAKGQWTATRAHAHPDAVMFTPQAVWARDFLRGRKNPPKSIRWLPNASYMSCDGRMAVNTGPWTTADGRQGGFFTTVWEKDKSGWRWISHGRHILKKRPFARKVAMVHKGACKGRAPGPPLMAAPVARKKGAVPDDFGRGHSADKTLGWDWRVRANGGRQFRAYLWNGRGYVIALDQTIGGK